MRVLMIGGEGRVGTWVKPHLSRRHHITTLDRAGEADVVADALDPQAVAAALNGQDAVVHLATVVPRGDQTTDPDTLRAAWATNVGSLWVALEQARRLGITRFVHCSTLAVFAGFARRPLDPNDPPDSVEPYGFSKRVAESAVEAYATQFGLHATSLRLTLPTPDDLAPLWLRPGDGQAVEVALPDGTVLPAAPASLVADAIDHALAFTGTFQAVPVAASAMPWA